MSKKLWLMHHIVVILVFAVVVAVLVAVGDLAVPVSLSDVLLDAKFSIFPQIRPG